MRGPAAAQKAESAIRPDENLAAKLRQSGRINSELSGRLGGALHKLHGAEKRIEELEAENRKLRGES